VKQRQVMLEIDSPLATCGSCRFTTALTGTWSVEDGRLVFRAALDPLTRRGPSIDSCCEGRHELDGDRVIEFAGVKLDGQRLGDEQFTALKASAASPEAWDEEQAGLPLIR
jgi:hypothetical protein